MGKIEIKYPNKNRNIRQQSIWFASGTSPAPASGKPRLRLRASIHHQGSGIDESDEFFITPIHYSGGRWSPLQGRGRIYRWLLWCHCRLNASNDKYELRVETINGGADPGTQEFTVVDSPARPAEARQVKPKEGKQITIGSHGYQDDITDEADAFVAYGPLQQGHTLTAARMVTTTATFNAIFTQSDGEAERWVAYWDPLPPGLYTLHVEDSGGHNDDIEELLIAEP